MTLRGEFVTDTATICVFDIACLKHRLDDEPEAIRGGTFIDMQPGEYTLCVSRNGTEISLSLHLAQGAMTNAFSNPIRI